MVVRDVGSELGVPEGTVKSRCYYALRALIEMALRSRYEADSDHVDGAEPHGSFPGVRDQAPGSPVSRKRERE